MGWSKLRLLAYKNEWFRDSLDHDGPACYEIGTGGPRGGNIQRHYVGETKNEKQRMTRYGSDGSHLSVLINRHLKDGWHIFYHAHAHATREEAEEEAGQRTQIPFLVRTLKSAAAPDAAAHAAPTVHS